MSNNWGRYALYAALAAAAFFLFKKCFSDETIVTQPTTLNIRMEAPATVLNPYMPAPGYSNFVAVRIFQTLGDFDPYSCVLKPQLAKSIPEMRRVTDGPHKGELAYDFEINPLAEWPNGTQVTGRDVEFSLKLIFHPSLPTARWRGFFEYVKSIDFDPTNPRKFTVYLSSYYMLGVESLCQYPIFPAYHYDPQGQLAGIPLTDFLDPAKAALLAQNPAAQAFATEFQLPKYKNDPAFIVGSGPYKLEAMNGDQSLSLVKKPNWWGDKAAAANPMLAAYPARIVYYVVTDETAVENMLRNEQLDIAVDVSPVNFRRMEKDPELAAKYDFTTSWTTRYTRWVFNLNKPKLNELAVRKALAHVVNYDDFIKNIQLGLAQRIVGPVNPRKSYYGKQTPLYNYDIEEAKRLLAAGGWTDTNNDGTVDKMLDGKRVELTLEMLATPSPKVSELVAASIVQSAALAGVKILLASKSIKEISDQTRAGQFETAIFAAAQNGGWADMYQNYHSASLSSLGGDNRNGFADTTFDRLVAFIRVTEDTLARFPAYAQAQQILHDQVPEVFLYSADYRIIVAKKYAYVISPNRPGYYEQMFRLK